MPDFDFGFGGETSTDVTPPTDGGKGNELIPPTDEKTNISTGKVETSNDATDLENDVNNGEKEEPKEDKKDEGSEENKSEYSPGTKFELDDKIYTVDENGNVIDDKGAIFKEAKDVADWIKSFNVDDTNENDITIDNIIKAVGTEIVDDDEKPIQFENTANGIKSYIDAVVEVSKNDVAEAAINTLFTQYPFVKDAINYYKANGNSLEGFNEIVDRSDVTLDKDNEEQQKEIIRTAWKERGAKGDVEGYIDYLKSSGSLATIAEDELNNLKQYDADRKAKLAEEAKKAQDEEIHYYQDYWNGVKEVIDSRKIANYQIPESIIINRNGQKLTVTPNDFFNYLYRVDKEGFSQYQRDLAAQDQNARRDDEILRAYLTFVGGNYSNLVDMAINEKEVKSIRLKAKQNNKSTLKITKPTTNDVKNGKDIDLGY